MRKTIFVLVAFAFLFSCKSEKEAKIKVNKVPTEGIVIDNWQVLGPFLLNPAQEHSINIDNLVSLGHNEAEITFGEYLNITKEDVKKVIPSDTSFTNKYLATGDTPAEFKHLPETRKKDFNANYYFACNIHCKRKIATRLHFANGSSEKIWLNHKLICSTDYLKPIMSYEQFIPVELNKGDNFLMVKVNVPNENWEMYARLENKNRKGMERYIGLHNHSIVYGSVFIGDDSIRLSPVFPKCNGKIYLYDNSNNLLLKDSICEDKPWSHYIKGYRPGNYLVKTNIEDIPLVQDIYIGNIHDSTKMIIHELENLKMTECTLNNFTALKLRYFHLVDNTYSTDKKFVTLFIQLRDILTGVKKGIDPFYHRPGNFIRSYKSDIDTSIQYYILHVPSTYQRGNALPVGITIPVNVYDKFPYLKSFRVANSKLIDFFQDLAEKYNMIIIEPGSRRKNKANYNSIEETELFTILDDVKVDYDIDMNRVYLAGTCSGGNELFKMTTRYPDLFAAVGVVAPDIHQSDETENFWNKLDNPIEFIANNVNLPILNIHSEIDRHVPVYKSDILKKAAKKVGVKDFVSVRLPNEFPKYYPDDFYDDIFNFTKQYTLNRSPNELDFTTSQMIYNQSFWITLTDFAIPSKAHIHAKIKANKLTVKKENINSYTIDLKTLPYNKAKELTIIDNGKQVFKALAKDTVLHIGLSLQPDVTYKNNIVAGPLAHVFSNRFILVKGTSGTKKETEAITALADTISKYWYERYFVYCMIKTDVEITNKDISESSLVLLGNAHSNQFLEKIGNTLPISISKSSIQIMDKITKGSKLCFYMVYPNPMNKTKYVAIIGYNNPDYISLGSEETNESYNDVSNYGWYDYKVWTESTSNNILLNGYFNSKWK